MRDKDRLEESWQTLVVVGHNPSISELVRFISAKGTLNLRVGKGCVVELEHDNDDNWMLVGLNNF